MINLETYKEKVQSDDIDKDDYNPFIKKNNTKEDSPKKIKENILKILYLKDIL